MPIEIKNVGKDEFEVTEVKKSTYKLKDLLGKKARLEIEITRIERLLEGLKDELEKIKKIIPPDTELKDQFHVEIKPKK